MFLYVEKLVIYGFQITSTIFISRFIAFRLLEASGSLPHFFLISQFDDNKFAFII